MQIHPFQLGQIRQFPRNGPVQTGIVLEFETDQLVQGTRTTTTKELRWQRSTQINVMVEVQTRHGRFVVADNALPMTHILRFRHDPSLSIPTGVSNVKSLAELQQRHQCAQGGIPTARRRHGHLTARSRQRELQLLYLHWKSFSSTGCRRMDWSFFPSESGRVLQL